MLFWPGYGLKRFGREVAGGFLIRDRVMGLMKRLRDYLFRASAPYQGVMLRWENEEPRIVALREKAKQIQLDPVSVLRQVRPRVRWFLSHDPDRDLVLFKIRRSLDRRKPLPKELHALALEHPDILADATAAYAEQIDPYLLRVPNGRSAPHEYASEKTKVGQKIKQELITLLSQYRDQFGPKKSHWIR